MSKTQLSVALEATQIGLWDWDIEHDRWHASAIYFTQLGYVPERHPECKVWLERVHPEDRARVRGAIDTALSGTAGVCEYEARLRHADGSYRWMSVRGKVVERDASGLARRMLGVRMDVTALKEQEEKLRRLAHFDALTGLPNRTLLDDRLAQAICMAARKQESVAVLVLDIDELKNVNDTFGWRLGDEILMEAARRMKARAREDDTVARMGGDKFAMLLPGIDADRAARAAGELLEAVSSPYRTAQLELVVTLSIGIALYPRDGASSAALLECAAMAMHRARKEGRNQHVFFTREMQIQAARNLVLENALRGAIERSELQLHYQPQVSLRDGCVRGVEALLRWEHPDLGNVSPAEFIPIAEDTGQIVSLGTWVLRSAVTQLRAWLDGGLEPLILAVNLSSVQFRQPNLPQLIRQILEQARLPPRCLELELTERVAMSNRSGATAVVSDLHRLGVRISIDDFGTGYSSLSYLKRFPAYKLKIDQSFTRGVTEDADDRAIISGVINLADKLGLRTLAEGVESAGQLAFLREQGCDEGQGYYFSEPLPADRFEALLRDTARRSMWLA